MGQKGRWFSTKLFKKNGREDLSENRIIGVAGLGSGVGVTHFCIMMANYLSGACDRRAALLEWGRQGEYGRMEPIVTGRQGPGEHYHLLDVDYYKNAGPEQLAACQNLAYHHVILDFGSMSEENKTEFFRCDKGVILASFSEWQMEAFWEFYRKGIWAEKKGFIYLTAFGSEESRLEIKKRLGLSFKRIPISVDAFTITKDIIGWFDQLFTPH